MRTSLRKKRIYRSNQSRAVILKVLLKKSTKDVYMPAGIVLFFFKEQPSTGIAVSERLPPRSTGAVYNE